MESIEIPEHSHDFNCEYVCRFRKGCLHLFFPKPTTESPSSSTLSCSDREIKKQKRGKDENKKEENIVCCFVS
jgi:hypothetical protein